jgi:hypothetical protein
MSSSYSGTSVDGSGQYETKAEADASKADFVSRWLAEIELASNEEKDWRANAERARAIYRAEKDGKRSFNILYSNVRTECSAIYNSTPVPDVRARHNDQSEVSRLAAQTIERALLYSLDSYDLDGVAKAVVQDSRLAGRGQGRVRYAPYEYQGKVYEEVSCEHVLWKHFRRGPANAWMDVPWVAFELFLTRDQLMELAPEIGGGINLDFALTEGTEQKADAPPNVFRRARVWEIWDKSTRKVIFIAPSYSAGPLRTEDDPLGLIGFFPVPEPIYGDRTYDSLVPMVPYQAYVELAEELEETTQRIQALVRVCRWRGYQHPSLPSFERLEEAADGELIPATEDVISLASAGGIDKFIWLMPLDKVIAILETLSVRQVQIKQAIFEISGLSDIQRGASDPNETLGAQEMKASFGSQRTQEQQKDVQRFCRDFMRLKAEIICNIFDPANIQMMTGLQQPSAEEVQQAQAQLQQMQAQQQAAQQAQAQQPPGMNGAGRSFLGGRIQGVPPSPTGAPMPGPPQPPPVDPAQMQKLQETAKAVPWEAIVEVLRGGVTRAYRIDIETDSTVRGDVRHLQDQSRAFLEGSGAFFQSFAPAVQTGFMPKDVAIDLYASSTRLLKLGKQAEDALSRWSQAAGDEAKNPQPQPPSPEEIKAKADAEARQQDMQIAERKAQMDERGMDREFQHKERMANLDFQVETRKAQLGEHLAERKAAMEDQQMQRDDMQAQREAALNEFVAQAKARHAANPQPQRRPN